MNQTAQPRPQALLSRLLAPRGCGRLPLLRRAVEGKVVLLTDTSFGIGAALARRQGLAGATVLLAARSREQLQDIVGEIVKAGGRAEVIPLDLADPVQRVNTRAT